RDDRQHERAEQLDEDRRAETHPSERSTTL
ncbi:MAG: hypothetical protein JWO36_5683, partial [Myxococcales bacterium]|nr:hypothetical protein [Myxococcales bacterium]